MIARLLISTNPDNLKKEIDKALACNLKGCRTNHPDVLYFKQGEKLGIAEAKKIKAHFSLKPYSAPGRGVVLEDASVMTVEAQNALLKTLEELPENAVLILGASSDANILPTILSRCQIIKVQSAKCKVQSYAENIEKLLTASMTERFEYVEKLKDKEEFLHSMVYYFRKLLVQNITKNSAEFLEKLLLAEKWAKQNVNIRAILEYLMLEMPEQI